jgi:hypothetical protein
MDDRLTLHPTIPDDAMVVDLCDSDADYEESDAHSDNAREFSLNRSTKRCKIDTHSKKVVKTKSTRPRKKKLTKLSKINEMPMDIWLEVRSALCFQTRN